MRYSRTERMEDGSVRIHLEKVFIVRDDELVEVEWHVEMSRSDVGDFLRTIGGDPCAHLGNSHRVL